MVGIGWYETGIACERALDDHLDPARASHIDLILILKEEGAE